MPDEFEKKITPEQVQAEYQKMLGYNTAVNLDETVRANENFFIGKQWEGVDAKGLPTSACVRAHAGGRWARRGDRQQGI